MFDSFLGNGSLLENLSASGGNHTPHYVSSLLQGESKEVSMSLPTCQNVFPRFEFVTLRGLPPKDPNDDDEENEEDEENEDEQDELAIVREPDE
jgi:hypothetical protein